MSRIAKKPIIIPEGVEVNIENNNVVVKKNGITMQKTLNKGVTATKTANEIVFTAANNAWMFAGTNRALVNNMVQGLDKGFTKKLVLFGVGYRVSAQGRKLIFNLGYSHPVEYVLPDAVKAKLDGTTVIVLSSHDKQLVGQVSANIADLRKPDGYKGKGVRSEKFFKFVKLKEVKKK